jgi:hypothetical protein
LFQKKFQFRPPLPPKTVTVSNYFVKFHKKNVLLIKQ